MFLRIPRPIGLIALVSAPFLAGASISMPVDVAHADDCLAAPNSPAPQGSHWYYHMDWAKQRKCWYLRAPGQPSEQTAAQVEPEAAPSASVPPPSIATPVAVPPVGAANSATPGDGAPSLPRVKMLSVKRQPAPTISAMTNEPLRRNAPEESAAPSVSPTLVPQEDAAQTGVRPPAPAPAVATVWPDPPLAIAAPTARNSITVSDDAGDGSFRPKADALISADAQSTGQHAAAVSTAPRQLPPATPAEMLLPVALGLAAAALLSRLIMKLAAARREPIVTYYAQSEWIDENLAPRVLDDQGQDDQGQDDQGQDDQGQDHLIGDRRQFDRGANSKPGRIQPSAASSRNRNAVSARRPTATVDDLEMTERVIMRALERVRA
jgi:hypothetical protein